MTAITYRAPTKADLPALGDIGRRTFTATFGHLYSEKDLNDFLEMVWGDAALAEEFTTGERAWQIAERDGRMVGYVKVGKPYTEHPAPEPGRRVTELAQLYVEEGVKGTGVADTLMTWAIDWATDCEFHDMILSVWAENARAQRFYARYGFTEIGRHIFMVGETEDDDRIWLKRLTPIG
ncbi:MAG: GNAT family N-acetyltransferase [Pacificimonas sp.]|jgi:ribosomal protein S18 acetylase RimI-like enzyme|nr:GNAT family N-acetyltransferase [Pacificimonas sp.]